MGLDDFPFDKCYKYVTEHARAFMINSSQGIASIVAEFIFCEGLKHNMDDIEEIVGILNKMMPPGSSYGKLFVT